ncbi:hypothetical protein [Minwuia sp.]|uniref:hypothetical protein n=1 Tax=Minwuia sp. TaxID=2493630 RepID=UPI003A93532B
MARAKISKVGGRTAVILPDEVAERFELFAGETVYVRDSARGLEITGMSPTEENDLRNGQRTLNHYRHHWRYAGE